ncbi:MAG TPA: hypothetical protein VM260_00820, partial [Pirellula sp.]|nr:hypothetical protein [Pirellula sp.]
MSEMEPTAVSLPTENALKALTALTTKAESIESNINESEVPNYGASISSRQPTAASLLLSTFLSLTIVLVLLVTLRYLLPSMLEFSRYSWHRGQLRAE